jgi:hypothetical protein
MSDISRKRKQNREAQSKYRERQKISDDELEDSIKLCEREIKSYKEILQARASEVPHQSTEMIIDQDRIRPTDPTTQSSGFYSDVIDVTEEPVASGSSGSRDLSPLFPQSTMQVDSDSPIDWEHYISNSSQSGQSVADGSGIDWSLDDLRPSVSIKEATVSPYTDLTTLNAPWELSKSPACICSDEAHYCVPTDSAAQDGEICAADVGSGHSSFGSEDSNLPDRTLNYPPYLGSGTPLHSTGRDLNMWPGAHLSEYTFGPYQTALQQPLYASQNVVLLWNKPIGVMIPCNYV